MKRPEISLKKPLVAACCTAAVMIGITSHATAQTCMVHCGTNAAGVEQYIEVYEYDYVSEKPRFPGGDDSLLKFVNKHREYPHAAYRAGIQGRVICSFVINTDGSVSNIRVLRGVEQSLNNEAMRVISLMPAWTPGKMRGRVVPVRVVYPITFRR